MNRNVDDAGNVETLKQTVVQVSTIVERLEARSAQAVQLLGGGVAVLEQGARRLNEGGERFAETALQAIRAQAHEAVVQGSGRAVGELQQQLQRSSDTAKWAADALAEQRRLLTAAQSTLIWKGLIALGMGSMLAAMGCGFYAWRTLRDVREAEFPRDILRATQSGVLVPCGDGALCIKVGAKPKRAGKDGEYVVLTE
ncbi:hypothetical protein J2X06_003321 [Lysobacter niastensis]|uniref:Relaxation protein n=2 Tax=Lysobacter niastensis TaxID=380629 RepID=A0ABU1WES7_9GAMM|nr:hypothetical protein [Lysobacter niastensis]